MGEKVAVRGGSLNQAFRVRSVGRARVKEWIVNARCSWSPACESESSWPRGSEWVGQQQRCWMRILPVIQRDFSLSKEERQGSQRILNIF